MQYDHNKENLLRGRAENHLGSATVLPPEGTAGDGGADPSFTDHPMRIPPRRNRRRKLEPDNLLNRTSSRDGGGGC